MLNHHLKVVLCKSLAGLVGLQNLTIKNKKGRSKIKTLKRRFYKKCKKPKNVS